MRLKKGFTLAEILIVLMVIGALATMTIPSLMKGVQEAQWKTAYKKAFNAIVNLTAMEKIAGNLPSSSDATGANVMFKSLYSSLSIKDYASTSDLPIAQSRTATTADYYSSVTFEDTATGTDTNSDESNTTSSGANMGANDTTSPWIISEDNIAYAVAATGGDCESKLSINGQATEAAARGKACVVVAVDVNGLSNQPNKLDNNIGSITESSALPALTGDRFYIYIGSDGATAGSKKTTITGRIAADLK